MNNNQNIQKKRENKYTFITMSVLIIILLISFIGIAKNNIELIFSNSNSNSNLLLKPINTTVSGKDGKSHSISAEFAISGNKKDIDKLNKDAINLVILDELKNLDFEEITGHNGDKKLKDSILKALKEKFSSINKIYIKNFTTDIQINQPYENNKNNRKDYLKGFKWNKYD